MRLLTALLLVLFTTSCVVAIGNKGEEGITCCAASERLGIDCPECAAQADEDAAPEFAPTVD
jgi:hypothetical protein